MQFDVICWSKIFKDNKIVVFEKLTSAHLHQIAREIMSLDNYLNEKAPQKVQTNEILAARALFVICIRVTTLHSCYMKNAFVFSQRDALNFFVYIIEA